MPSDNMSIDKDIWKKSYMLEFVYSGTKTKTEIFTFSLPPESEDFDFPHRVTETKTFGGSIFDSYGNDTVKINLSGSTVNNEKKKIYKGANNEENLSGEEEIWKLREIISDANDIENDVTVYLYDLSKIDLNTAGNAGQKTKNYWKVNIKDFRIKRDKTKPFTYNYTMEIVSANETKSDAGNNILSLLDDIDENSVIQADSIPQNPMLSTFSNNWLNSGRQTADGIFQVGRQVVGGVTDTMDEVTSFASETATGIQDAVNTASTVAEEIGSWVDELGSEIQEFCDAINEAVSPILDFVNQTVSTLDALFDEIDLAYETFTTGDAVQISRYISSRIDTGLRLLDISDANNFTHITDSVIDTTEMIVSIATVRERMEAILPQGATFESTRYYNVTFNSLGGSLYKTVRVAFGNKVTQPNDPVKEHYAFDGWYSDSACTTEFDFDAPLSDDNLNITLYAKWKVSEVAVTFYGNGGVSPVPVVYVTVGGKVDIPEEKPSRSGYVFDRWYKDRDCSIVFDENTAITEPTTLYAGWSRAVTVSFESNGGSVVAEENIRNGGKAVYPLVPTKKNYAFVAWYSDSELSSRFDFNTAVTRNITLYAKWELVTATVIFIPNGGSEVPPQTVKIGKKVTSPECEKTGADITAWCTDIDLTNAYDFNTAVTGDLTLYAKWNTATYTVTFDSMGGSAVAAGSVLHGNCIVYPAIPTKANCIFKYWQKKIPPTAEGGEETYEEYDFSTPATGNITLYAAWFNRN